MQMCMYITVSCIYISLSLVIFCIFVMKKDSDWFMTVQCKAVRNPSPPLKKEILFPKCVGISSLITDTDQTLSQLAVSFQCFSQSVGYLYSHIIQQCIYMSFPSMVLTDLSFNYNCNKDTIYIYIYICTSNSARNVPWGSFSIIKAILRE